MCRYNVDCRQIILKLNVIIHTNTITYSYNCVEELSSSKIEHASPRQSVKVINNGYSIKSQTNRYIVNRLS